MNRTRLRWGILGTANVARKNWRALQLAGNTTVTAVASRDVERARRFVDECQAEVPFPVPPSAFGSYAELIASPEVDAVYCPLPTGLRKEWVLRAAAAGKHVICEKPCAPSAADLREMLDACRRHGVQFMDGVMFVHSRRTARLLEVVNDGTSIGEVRRIATQFTFRAPDDFAAVNIRGQAHLEPQGCVGDLGWYCIRLSLVVLGGRTPDFVTARCLNRIAGPDGRSSVPAELSAELHYPGGVTSSFYCSFLAGLQQWASISGTLGHLHIADYILPHVGDELGFEVGQPEFHVNGCEFRMEPNLRRYSVPERSHGGEVAPETNLFRNFSARVLSGELDLAWPEIALRTQQVLDACMTSAERNGAPVEVRPS